MELQGENKAIDCSIDYPDYDKIDFNLTDQDANNIKLAEQRIKLDKQIFSIDYRMQGDVKVYNKEEEMNIDLALLSVSLYVTNIKCIEKHTGVEYSYIL